MERLFHQQQLELRDWMEPVQVAAVAVAAQILIIEEIQEKVEAAWF
jgi:hypothetical protein